MNANVAADMRVVVWVKLKLYSEQIQFHPFVYMQKVELFLGSRLLMYL